MVAIKKPITLVTTVLLLSMCMVYWYFNPTTHAVWHMINVNSGKFQGDAHLITIGDQNILIDAGYKSEAIINLAPYLHKLKINRIHHFFVSHPHRDHYEGIAAIWDNIVIDNLYVKIPPKEICDREIPWGCDYSHIQKFINDSSQRGMSIHHPTSGFNLNLPFNSTLKVLHAQETDLTDSKIDVNDLSMVMKWTIQDFTVLFTGDLNFKLGKQLASDPRMKARFLKMPHHGLANLAPNAFFETVNPEYVLVPGPEELWCAKRGKQARTWLQENSIPYWVNGLHGNIQVEFSANKSKIIQEKNKKCNFNEANNLIPHK